MTEQELVPTLQVQSKYLEASKKGEKLYELRRIRSDLMSCKYVNLQCIDTREIVTFEVGYRFPLREANGWWNKAFQGDSANYMIIGLKPTDNQLRLEG